MGRLLEGPRDDAAIAGDEWQHVRLPALAEEEDPIGRPPGAPLWPARYDNEALAKLRAGIGPQDWAGLFQQRPAEQGGGLFKFHWWTYCRHVARAYRRGNPVLGYGVQAGPGERLFRLRHHVPQRIAIRAARDVAQAHGIPGAGTGRGQWQSGISRAKST